MNRVPEKISDEELSAWVDGELDAAAQARIEAWLEAHPEDAARPAAWAADRREIAALFGPVAAEPVPPALAATVWRRAGPPRWTMAAAAAGLLLVGGVVGGGLVWQQQQREFAGRQLKLAAGTPQGWVQRAAFAHSVYTIEPRHPVEVKAQEDHLARWLTKRIDVPVKLFDLREQGFELVGGRLLPDGPGKSAQLMYQDAKGLRVTVYLRKPEQGTDAAFRFEQQGELGLFYWIEEGCGYALVGALPRATLLALAESIYKQHPVATPEAAPAGPAPAAAPPASAGG